MADQRIADVDEMQPGSLKRADVNGVPVCVARTADGTVYAFDDRCSHESSSLADGDLEGNEVECPAHSSRFDVRTGVVTCGPAKRPIRTYRTLIAHRGIYVQVSVDDQEVEA